jgi:hypothetical protein
MGINLPIVIYVFYHVNAEELTIGRLIPMELLAHQQR